MANVNFQLSEDEFKLLKHAVFDATQWQEYRAETDVYVNKHREAATAYDELYDKLYEIGLNNL